ncbi:hypothetical protein DMI65_13745 [Escherichia coli]|nr:hypothetical protein [Escherichia coli]
MGAWRLRDNTTSYNSSDSSSGSKKWAAYQCSRRDIIPLRSRLTLGDGYTQGDIFDGINFRGAQWPQMTICYPIAKEDLPR